MLLVQGHREAALKLLQQSRRAELSTFDDLCGVLATKKS
jgi:hypothetical protein